MILFEAFSPSLCCIVALIILSLQAMSTACSSSEWKKQAAVGYKPKPGDGFQGKIGALINLWPLCPAKTCLSNDI
ncbi:hypothetical protein N7519_009881 [Penicillium mononematosum]|uniref:uncharacterized protein n=1 Tax=Penicillium mononematosum TaxID=268346 RepID=UPI0025490E66|nr:uncharacterized protein N7519_009881 [Penicillium mononematosum]KAJ6179420.1 hypothetical protein N7519_009881 [Penicillium mononematosum]